MRLTNPTNAFVRIETGPYVVLCDPWLTVGIYEGGWRPYPPIQLGDSHLEGATHLFITHIHADHYDLQTIDRLDRAITVVIPEVYPSHVTRATLAAMGFEDIRVLALSTPTEVAAGLTMEALPPMNSFGQEAELYEKIGTNPIAIDSGLILSAEGVCIALLADDTPYQPTAVGESLARLISCDLIAFPYNGAAADYPLCYSFSDAEIREISDAREQRREHALDQFFELARPRAIMPYSSDFSVAGPQAREFAKLGEFWWMNKFEVAERYGARHGIQSLALLEGDALELTPGSIEVERGGLEHPTLEEVAETCYSEAPLTESLYPMTEDLDALDGRISAAAQHMFASMDKHGLESEWVLAFRFVRDEHEPVFIDLGLRDVGAVLPEGRKVLECTLDVQYFYALVSAATHWSNGQLSFQLSWNRVPNEFDHQLYAAINFLHVPRTTEIEMTVATAKSVATLRRASRLLPALKSRVGARRRQAAH